MGMMCVDIIYIDDDEILYRIINDDGNHNMDQFTIDRYEWDNSQHHAFRRVKHAPPPVERSVILNRDMIGKRGAGGTKRRRQRKSKKTIKKRRKQSRYSRA